MNFNFNPEEQDFINEIKRFLMEEKKKNIFHPKSKFISPLARARNLFGNDFCWSTENHQLTAMRKSVSRNSKFYEGRRNS